MVRFADSDVRQPFLAGGVTFCRMVPMRLIPFRAICLVGLNDRDYPRREASPVLNRLAAALGGRGQFHPPVGRIRAALDQAAALQPVHDPRDVGRLALQLLGDPPHRHRLPGEQREHPRLGAGELVFGRGRLVLLVVAGHHGADEFDDLGGQGIHGTGPGIGTGVTACGHDTTLPGCLTT